MSDNPVQRWHAHNPAATPTHADLKKGAAYAVGFADGHKQADRIEALTAERDEANKRGDAWRFRADIAEVKLAKALAGLDKAAALIEDRHVVHMTSKGRNPKDYISDWSLIAKEVRATLAEVERTNAP